MSGSILDFDEVAADDALIESLRAGATVDELPSDDAAVDALLALRDGDVTDDEVRTVVSVPARAVVAGVVSHRRSLAVSAIVGVVATAGVGTAVAGDPTAAFSYLFRQGVEVGSRLGTPPGDVDMGGMGHAGQYESPVTASSVPVRQGSAAAPMSIAREPRGPVGFERGSRYWTVPAPRGLESLVGDGRDSARGNDRHDGVDGFGDEQITDGATTVGPHETETVDPGDGSTSPPGEGDVDNDSDTGTDPSIDSDESTDPTSEPPTEGGETTLTESPSVTTEPPPETTTPPPETTTPPPDTTTSPPPETTSSPPPTSTSPPSETTTSPPETTTEPTETGSPSSPTATSSAQ